MAFLWLLINFTLMSSEFGVGGCLEVELRSTKSKSKKHFSVVE
jgi:hypothetical protein